MGFGERRSQVVLKTAQAKALLSCAVQVRSAALGVVPRVGFGERRCRGGFPRAPHSPHLAHLEQGFAF